MYLSMEFKRSIYSRLIIPLLFLHVAAVGLGYILLTALDKVNIVTTPLLAESVYTVYTQFGIFFFAPLFIHTISGDYKDKNIIFYKTLGVIPSSYFLQKLLLTLIYSLVGSFISSVLICIPYNYFTVMPFFFLKVFAVMMFYSIITLFLAFMLGKFLTVFFTVIILWIVGIFIAQITLPMHYFAYYDATAQDYKLFINFLRGTVPVKNILYIIINNYIFDLILLVASLLAISLSKKKWVKHGIY